MSTSKTFGAFFRGSRKALGLTLSEFCRRNGFDKGNISRLERGLVPPPQAQELLESYAKALKLEDGAGSQETFFELAAVETGRIPSNFLEDQHAMQKLPRLLRQMRVSGQGHTSWIKALDLERWADTLDARGTLPELVRRLIRASGKAIRPIEFPAHEQVQRPGWDGIVESDEASEFVPAGTSVWELGVEKDPRKKAEDDFGKRTKATAGLDKKETTFIFVTPRKWQKKAEWRRAKQATGIWKDVRVYDSATLEEWLEQSPGVDAGLAGMLGKKPPGLTTIDDYWANLQAMTDPSLKPEVFLASREEEVKKLQAWLDGPPSAMVIEARSPAETIDFVAAYSRGPSRAEWFGARALIVETRDAWRSVSAAAGAGLLLIAHPSLSIEQELVAEAVRQGHRVLISSAQAARETMSSIQLPRAYRHDLEKELASSGLNEESSRRLAREAGGNLTVLKRLLGRVPGTNLPEWSRASEASALVPMLLAGSWDESSESDCSAIAKLSGRPYRDVVEVVERWRMASDSPFSHVGSHWRLVSRDDSWHFLASAVTADHFRRFEEIALEVLAQDDPISELSLPQQWIARRDRKDPRYSQALRNGLVETLAFLGANPERLPSVPGTERRIEDVVRKLLDRQECLRWVSLSNQLPLLAEAGPEAFLETVERDLKRSGSAVMKLFEQEDSLPWPTSRYASLLWSLEVLAWNRDWLPRVSLILAALDERTSGEKLGSYPSRSLMEIFAPWLPQTSAPAEERIKILKKLVESRRDAGWRLLIGLLPNQLPFSTEIYRPLWRDWALDWVGRPPTTDQWQQAVASAHLLLEQLGEDLERWKEIIRLFEHLPGPARTEFLERLNALATRPLDGNARDAISESLRKKVSEHRRFANANWVLPAQVLSELEKLQRAFEPEDPVRRNAWLFGRHWQVLDILEGMGGVDEVRRSTLQEIFDRGGWEGIQRLVREVEAPEAVGIALADLCPDQTELRILPDFLSLDDEKTLLFAKAYVAGRFRKERWDWVNRLKMDHWSVEEVGQLLVALPFERKTWDFAAAKGDEVATWYWNNSPFPRGEEGDDTNHAVTMLLRHKRTFQAFVVLQAALHRKVALESSLLMDAIETWLATGAGGLGRIQGFAFLILSLFQELQERAAQKDSGTDVNRLAKLEWACLGLLNGHPTSPVTLHGLLRDEPESFVELLSLVFRPKDQPAEESNEISEEERQRAQNAYRLLKSWRKIPGSRDDRTIDETALLAWVQKARSLAKDRGLLEICDSRIGEVLAHDPHGYDLQLMSSVKDACVIPTAGKRLIIVARVDQILHFRIFDGDGKMVVDTDSKRLNEKTESIEDLRRKLQTMWPPAEPTESERNRVIATIASIVNFTPQDEDDSWPSIPVRDALEEIGTDEVFEGFSVGIYNNRGMVTKSLREGGAQERELAEKYRTFADASKIEWPRTAKELRDIAKGYEEKARREDERASLDD
jgi:transcriptional regulator with XRE-family HTH domain